MASRGDYGLKIGMMGRWGGLVGRKGIRVRGD